MTRSNDLLKEVLELGKEFMYFDADENPETFKQKSGIKLFLNHWFGSDENKMELNTYMAYCMNIQRIFTDMELMEISFSFLNKKLTECNKDNMLTVMIKAYPIPVHYYFFEYLKTNFF